MQDIVNNELIRMIGIDKYYPGVHALDNVNFELKCGEVHVLLGANGAGKSTLIKILSGAEKMDRGEIYINGELVDIRGPNDVKKRGIFTIYQNFTLVPALSVAENVCLGEIAELRGWINWENIKEKSINILNKLGSSLDITRKIESLSVEEKQLVEIARALSREGKVLILDEPTSALNDEEVKKLFDRINLLKQHGVGIIYISHRLDELKKIGDRATVLRDGRNVGTVSLSECNQDKLITMILGRKLEADAPRPESKIERKLLLKAEKLSHPKGKFRDISFELYQGEVIGMAGLLGSGRKEFVRALWGIDNECKLEIEIQGKKNKIKSPDLALKSGLYYLPSDRHREGLFLNLSIADNITVGSLNKLLKGGFLSLKKQILESSKIVDKLRIKTPSVKTIASNLSGGNQQKVVVGRSLYRGAQIFIFDEPTVGIDVGTKFEIRQIIKKLVEDGAGVIIISQELSEIIQMSDRILAWKKGSIVANLNKKEVKEDLLLNMISG